MTNFNQFLTKAKTRHDYSDMIQVRYYHPNGDEFDTWVSGEEVMQRLDTKARERVVKSFSQKNWQEAKEALRVEFEKGKQKAQHNLKNRLADIVSDQIGGNIFSDTLAANIRGHDSNIDPYERERAEWQTRLLDAEFRALVLQLAWITLEGTMPDEEGDEEAVDWV